MFDRHCIILPFYTDSKEVFMRCNGKGFKQSSIHYPAVVCILLVLFLLPACVARKNEEPGKKPPASHIPQQLPPPGDVTLETMWTLPTSQMLSSLKGPIGETVVFSVSGQDVKLRDALFPLAMHYVMMKQRQGEQADIQASFVRDSLDSVLLSSADQSILAQTVESVLTKKEKEKFSSILDNLINDLLNNRPDIKQLLNEMGLTDQDIRRHYHSRLMAREFLFRQQKVLSAKQVEPGVDQIMDFYNKNRDPLFLIQEEAVSDNSEKKFKRFVEVSDLIKGNLMKNALLFSSSQQVNDLREKACLRIHESFDELVRRARSVRKSRESVMNQGRFRMKPAQNLVKSLIGEEFVDAGIKFMKWEEKCTPQPLAMPELADAGPSPVPVIYQPGSPVRPPMIPGSPGPPPVSPGSHPPSGLPYAPPAAPAPALPQGGGL